MIVLLQCSMLLSISEHKMRHSTFAGPYEWSIPSNNWLVGTKVTRPQAALSNTGEGVDCHRMFSAAVRLVNGNGNNCEQHLPAMVGCSVVDPGRQKQLPTVP